MMINTDDIHVHLKLDIYTVNCMAFVDYILKFPSTFVIGPAIMDQVGT